MRKSTESLLSAIFPDIASSSQINQLCRIIRKPHQRQRLILSSVSVSHDASRDKAAYAGFGCSTEPPACACTQLGDEGSPWQIANLNFSLYTSFQRLKRTITCRRHKDYQTSLHPSIKHHLNYILLCIVIFFLSCHINGIS